MNRLYYGDHQIDYALVRNPALVSKVRIHVHANGRVEVEAPPGRQEHDIRTAVRKRARWISKRLSYHEESRRNVVARDYKSGETHFYQGRRYQLKVVKVRTATEQAVTLKGAAIRVGVADCSPIKVRRGLRSWYRDRAKEYFAKRLKILAADIPWIDKAPPIKLTAMRKQWGSCSPRGSINLNPDLIRAPRECIDYVIVHELCHLQEHNHSKRYYALLDRYCPNWRSVKRRLDDMAELLLVS